jgi:CheY-like chemotaxis protein
MQNARIFLVEDEELRRKIARRRLEAVGHQIVLEAADLKRASYIIRSGQLQEKGIDVVIIDGCFPDGADDERFEFNGPKVAAVIRQHYPDMKIIAFTSVEEKYVTYGIYVKKGNDDWENLQKTIDSL